MGLLRRRWRAAGGFLLWVIRTAGDIDFVVELANQSATGRAVIDVITSIPGTFAFMVGGLALIGWDYLRNVRGKLPAAEPPALSPQSTPASLVPASAEPTGPQGNRIVELIAEREGLQRKLQRLRPDALTNPISEYGAAIQRAIASNGKRQAHWVDLDLQKYMGSVRHAARSAADVEIPEFEQPIVIFSDPESPFELAYNEMYIRCHQANLLAAKQHQRQVKDEYEELARKFRNIDGQIEMEAMRAKGDR